MPLLYYCTAACVSIERQSRYFVGSHCSSVAGYPLFCYNMVVGVVVHLVQIFSFDDKESPVCCFGFVREFLLLLFILACVIIIVVFFFAYLS